jgi:peptide deformylase
MNDDVLVIDTGAKSPTKVVEEQILPLPILTEGNSSLKIPVEDFDITQISQPDIQKFIKQLKLTMRTYNGVGLSANQCGFKFRMFVIGTDQFQMTCINPRIIDVDGEPKLMREGCLSYPALFVSVPRYEGVLVEYYNENSEKKELWLRGLTAQCFQHELEHLDGKVFIERVKPLAMQMARKRQTKLIKKIVRHSK